MARLQSAVEDGSLPRDRSGLGPLLDGATSLRGAASTAASFSARRLSGMTHLVGGDVHLNDGEGVTPLKLKRQKNDQSGVGRMAHLVAMDAWARRGRRGYPRVGCGCGVGCASIGAVRVVCLGPKRTARSSEVWLAPDRGWEWRRPRPLHHGGRYWAGARRGTRLSPRPGGTRVHIVNGMSLEATQELHEWKPPGDVESVYNKDKSEEVFPEIRGTIGRACALLAVEAFVTDLDRDASLAVEIAQDADRGACTSAWFRWYCTFKEPLAPVVALPIRGNFMSILRRRVRTLLSPDTQKRVVLWRGAECRAALRGDRVPDFRAAARARDRDGAVEDIPSRQFRIH